MPIVRRPSGRVLRLDDRERVHLLHGGDPSRPHLGQWWFTVGGGCEANETTEQAARRELREETEWRRSSPSVHRCTTPR